jgi:hypothetical protein
LWHGLEGEVVAVVEGAFVEVIIRWPDPFGTVAHGERSFSFLHAR